MGYTESESRKIGVGTHIVLPLGGLKFGNLQKKFEKKSKKKSV